MKSWVAGAAIGVASMMAAISPSQAGVQSFGQLQMEKPPLADQVKFSKPKRNVRVRDYREKADRVRARPGNKQRETERTRIRDFRKNVDRVRARPGKEQRVHARPGS